MRNSRATVFTLTLCCFLLGVGLRLFHISDSEPGPDERHWVARSSLFRARIARGDYGTSTTLLGHPGIPAAFAMALGQAAAARWNKIIEPHKSDAFHIDSLIASRIGIAIFSSLIFPLMFLSGRIIFGDGIALFATLLLIFDNPHLAASKIAHIDSTLALLVAAAATVFVISEIRASVPLKLFAGLLWGLALVTKPTAVALIPALLLFKLARRLFWTDDGVSPRPPLIGWSDVWAILAGHLALITVWTKVWDPKNNFISFLHVDPHLCYVVRDIGAYLQSTPLIGVIVVVLTILACWLLTRQKQPSSLLMLALLLSVALLSLWIIPQVVENTIRFWGWVGGLSNTKHEAYGHAAAAVGQGYLNIWFRRVPSILVLGPLLGLFILILGIRRKTVHEPQISILILLMAIPLCYIALLSVSPKQTVRYVLPTIPAAYLFTSWALWEVLSRLKRSSALSKAGTFTHLPAVGLGACLLVQVWSAARWFPYPSNFFNSISGGLEAGVAQGASLDPVGYRSALTFLHNEAQARGYVQKLSVAGDIDLMRFEYRRIFGADARFIEFESYHSAYLDDWLLEFSAFEDLVKSLKRYDGRLELVSTYEIEGIRVYSFYRILPPDFRTPWTIPLSHTVQQTGTTREDGRTERVRIAYVGKHSEGYLQHGQVLRGAPGRYRIRYALSIPRGSQAAPASTQPVVRLEAGDGCTRNVLAGELTVGAYGFADLICDFHEAPRVPLRTYWLGTVSVKLAEFSIQKLD